MNEERIKSLKIKGNEAVLGLLHQERDNINRLQKSNENDDYIAFVSKEILRIRDDLNEIKKEKFSFFEFIFNLVKTKEA